MRRLNQQLIQLVTALVLSGVPYLVWQGQSYAYNQAELANRNVVISTATPSEIATHNFQMTLTTNTPLGSIVFEYCANSAIFTSPCVPPPGLSLNAAVLAQQGGNTGFSVNTAASSANQLVLGRTLAAGASVPSRYVFTGITNPSGNNSTTYVRISTHASNDGTGSFIESGAVAFTTVANFQVGAYIPPFLNMCVGVTVSLNCVQSNGDSLDLGILTKQATRSATSQFSAATNADTGYAAFVLGTTMTSGNNVIPAPASPSANRPGVGQFGLNLRKNNGPSVGADPFGPGTAVPSVGYNSPDLFNFVPGSQIASSDTSTDFTLMTVSYVVNVDGSQPAGVYTTTLTYLASAQF